MPEPDPRAAGFDPDRLARLAAVIEDDLARERYDGCEVVVGRGGMEDSYSVERHMRLADLVHAAIL